LECEREGPRHSGIPRTSPSRPRGRRADRDARIFSLVTDAITVLPRVRRSLVICPKKKGRDRNQVWYRPDPGDVAIHPGDILAGYRVTRLLGRGGMGEVWAAISDAAGREVAVKVLLARAAMKPDLVRRFQREAEIARAIKSPYVCQLLEVAENEDGAHLLVFERLHGESLADRLKREQYLPLSEVGPIIDDVIQGLVAAHAAGVIHRDLKPGNIFLESLPESARPPQGMVGNQGEQRQQSPERAKVLDFGISKLTRPGKEEPTLTAFDATLGSFAYMAPEQVRGAARADERADIYAIGAVTFRALAGRLPFEGATAAVLVSMKLDRSAPSLAEATGEKWPAGVERFLERALARRREDRFNNAAEALTSWRAIQPENITRARRTSARARGTEPPPPQDDPATVVDGPPEMTIEGTFADGLLPRDEGAAAAGKRRSPR
jgi:serine/threonine-protein kinase